MFLGFRDERAGLQKTRRAAVGDWLLLSHSWHLVWPFLPRCKREEKVTPAKTWPGCHYRLGHSPKYTDFISTTSAKEETTEEVLLGVTELSLLVTVFYN